MTDFVRNYYYILFLLFSFFWSSNSDSRSFDNWEESLSLRTVNFTSEFPSAGIWNTLQDSKGLIWFSSNNGLYRYDGNNLIQFNLQSSPALPYIPFDHFVIDKEDNLWIGHPRGVAKFDTKKWQITTVKSNYWTNARHPEDKNISTIFCNANNEVIFGNTNGKIYKARGDSLIFLGDAKVQINQFFQWDDTHLGFVTNDGKIGKLNIRDGFKQKLTIFSFQNVSHNSFNNIFIDSSRNFLIVGDFYKCFAGNLNQLEAQSVSRKENTFISTLNKITFPFPNASLIAPPFYLAPHKKVAILSKTEDNNQNIYLFDFFVRPGKRKIFLLK